MRLLGICRERTEHTQYYNSKTDFFQECKDAFGLTEYRLRKVCGNIGDMDIEDYLEQSYEKLTNYLREQEEIKVNDCLDRIKQTYGYKEYKTECIKKFFKRII